MDVWDTTATAFGEISGNGVPRVQVVSDLELGPDGVLDQCQ
jgi:hypothetical protein